MILKSVNFEDKVSCTKAKTGARKYYLQQIKNSISKFSTFLKESTFTVEKKQAETYKTTS